MSLSKRTHIMLDPKMFDWLKHRASRERRTIGSLVRILLEKEYQSETDRIRQDRKAAIRSMTKLRKQFPVKGPLDIRALIEEGRKY